METAVARYFKPDGKPGRPKKRDRDSAVASFEYPGRDYFIPKESKRRALLQLSGTHYTSEQWLGLLSEYNNRCLRCGKQTSLTADHVVPAILEGTKTLDYRPGFVFEII